MLFFHTTEQNCTNKSLHFQTHRSPQGRCITCIIKANIIISFSQYEKATSEVIKNEWCRALNYPGMWLMVEKHSLSHSE